MSRIARILIVGGVLVSIAAMVALTRLGTEPAYYESSAISSLRGILSGEAAYASSCAKGYAIDLADLAKTAAGRTDSQSFVAPDLASNGTTRSGYVITLARNAAPDVKDLGPSETCNGSNIPLASSFFASANPVKPGSGSRLYFATD